MKHSRLSQLLCLTGFFLIGFGGCEQDKNNPVSTSSDINYYVGQGKAEGVINGDISSALGVITLPAGTWRIRYKVDTQWWQLVVRSQQQACHYIGTFTPMDSVVVQSGTHPSLLGDGLLEGSDVTESAWQALSDSRETWIFRDGVLAAEITPMDREDFCPKATYVPTAPNTTPSTPSDTPTTSPTTKTCGGISSEGGCWYLSEVSKTCNETCQTQGLIFDTTLDTPTANFWSVHTVEFCGQLLSELYKSKSLTLPSPKSTSALGDYGMCSADAATVLLHQNGKISAGNSSPDTRIACPCKSNS